MSQRLFGPIRSALAARAVHRMSNGRPVVVHRVKTSRAGRLKRALMFGAATYVLFSAYQTVVFGSLSKALDSLAEDEEQGEEEDDEELEPIFIPLPFTTRQIDPPPYSGKDPEWREFIKASKDKDLQKKLRDNLAGIVTAVAGKSVLLTTRFGKDIKVRRLWVDVDYPYRPPPEFERVGILVDDYFELASQKVDPTIVTLTQRILYPTPLLWSTLSFTTTLMKQNISDVAKLFGWQPKEPPSTWNGLNTPTTNNPQPLPAQTSSVQKTLQRIRDESTRRPEEVEDPGAMVAPKSQGEDARPSKEHFPISSDTRITKHSHSSVSPPEQNPSESITAHDTVRGIIGTGPWDAFKGTWAKTFKPIKTAPPRGSFLVSGLVELEAPRATIVIDVAAWYDPKTMTYDGKSMFMGVRRVQLKTQSPLR